MLIFSFMLSATYYVLNCLNRPYTVLARQVRAWLPAYAVCNALDVQLDAWVGQELMGIRITLLFARQVMIFLSDDVIWIIIDSPECLIRTYTLFVCLTLLASLSNQSTNNGLPARPMHHPPAFPKGECAAETRLAFNS